MNEQPLTSGGEFELPPPAAPFKPGSMIQVGSFILKIESIGKSRGVFSFAPKHGEMGESRRVAVPTLDDATTDAVEALNRTPASKEGAVALLQIVTTFCKAGMEPRDAINTAAQLIQ